MCTNDSVSKQRTNSTFLGRDSRLLVACYTRKTKLHAFGKLRSCSAADFLRHAHLSLSHRDGSSRSRKLFDHATKLDMPHSQRISSTRYLTTTFFLQRRGRKRLWVESEKMEKNGGCPRGFDPIWMNCLRRPRNKELRRKM